MKSENQLTTGPIDPAQKKAEDALAVAQGSADANQPTAPETKLTLAKVRSEIQEAFKRNDQADAMETEHQAHIRSDIGFS